MRKGELHHVLYKRYKQRSGYFLHTGLYGAIFIKDKTTEKVYSYNFL